MMVEFQNPPIGMSISQYMELVRLWKACSSCVGFCIALGKKFFDTGVKEVDETILPAFSASTGSGISPRVIPAYAILYWFAVQVSIMWFVIILFGSANTDFSAVSRDFLKN